MRSVIFNGFIAVFSFSLALGGNLQAGIIYSEGVDGPASNVPGSPTLVSLSLGSNEIIGEIGPSAPTNNDHYTFTIGTSQSLDSILLLAYGVTNISRFDIFAGSTAGTPFLGFVTAAFRPSDIGSDLLLGTGAYGPGVYTISLQESNAPIVPYEIQINVSSAVPEPASLTLVGLGAFGLVAGAIRRRRSQK